ncbi:MAG: homoserine kinase [Actinomycetes bacterium]
MAGAMFRAAPVRVRVPATAANLGPGFDACGLALALYDDIVVQVTESGLDVQVAGEGADKVPSGERHLVVKAMRAAFKVLGGQPRGLALRCANRVPQGRGLGSSAAAIVSGVVAARSLVVGGVDRLDDLALLRLAVSMEGHPDNVAACLLGGFTVAWTEPGGVRAVSSRVPDGVVPVALVPTTAVSTAKARRMLPESVPFADAAHSAGRAALLSVALTTRPDLLLPATDDRLHQQYRAEAMPRSAALVDRLRAAGLPAVIAGAGPTVLVLASPGTAAKAVAAAPRGWEVHELAIDSGGASILPME